MSKLDKDLEVAAGNGDEPHKDSHAEADAIIARLDNHKHEPTKGGSRVTDTSSRPE